MNDTSLLRILRSIPVSLRRIPEKRLLIIIALVVGVLCGLAAVVLKLMVDNLAHFVSGLSTGNWNFVYLVLPGIGMLVSFLLVRYVIKRDVGHGVTKVLLAVSKNESKIEPRQTWASLLTSAVTIGFGGSVGAEAPIVYTGAAIGSNMARLMKMSYKNMTILLGCGAAGAVAGIFKAPLAGVLFTLEILLFNISMTSILPLLLSSVSATVVSYIFLGQEPSFAAKLLPFSMGNIPFYVILGFFCGAVSLYFTRTTLSLEDRIKNISNPYKRWILCAIGLGLLIFLFPPLYGEGYSSINLLLSGSDSLLDEFSVFSYLGDSPWVLLVFVTCILFFKVFAMTFTNAGGGVGGTFGPTLFIGGIAGFVMARFANLLGFSVPEPNFVLVGMAGTMAGVMQAPLTAIFLIAEISGGYELLIPLILTSAISFAFSRSIEPYSIYTKRIAKKGELLTHDSDQAVLTLLKLSDVIENDFKCVKVEDTLGDLVKTVSESTRNIFPIVDSKGRFQGFVELGDIRSKMFDRSQYDRLHVWNFLKQAPEYVYIDDHMDTVMKKFEVTGAWNLPVIGRDRKYYGFVSKSKIFSSYRKQLQQVSHD
ncbi:hypothetical protein B5F83_02730 [Muribaculum sp. An289]|uniref:Chloride channel protein n=1 Tax=Candidatus Merdivivens faecigallinarum TaxID=2840871 RepID=A0A9D9J149_9BACT|nr:MULTISPECIES: chloride channel protein [unclassified Muribaculum]MBO8482355.1 chloride channel protein [Candidatus Merdivivens faecigallinarum]OUO38162.1 hypothetical protein B5F83_02730 [Muribaculum sp. An289]OUO44185.1 hypothetical protein B5F81_00120 [Muribaculum sp. An287]